MNPVAAIKYLNLLNRFKATVTTSEGKKIVVYIKLTADDLSIIDEIKKAKAE